MYITFCANTMTNVAIVKHTSEYRIQNKKTAQSNQQQVYDK